MSDDSLTPGELVADAVGTVEAVVAELGDATLKTLDTANLAGRLWNDVLRANRGGHHRAGTYTTDFEAVPTVAALRAMIDTADPAAVQAVADHWQHLHDELQDTAAQLTTHADNLLEHWTGSSADAFRVQAETLHSSLVGGAAHAASAARATEGVAHALAQARADMPADPSLLDSVVRAVTTQSTDWQFKTDAAKHGLAHALAADGAQLSAPEQARQQAVVVMERLGVSYNDATARLDHLPTPPAQEHGHGPWPPPPPPPTTAHASLLGYGHLRAGAADLGAGGGVPGGAQGLGAAPAQAPGPTAWIGAGASDVSPTAVASVPETGRAEAPAGEPEPGPAAQAGEGLRPSAGSGTSGSRGRRSRTRYAPVTDPDTWDTPPRANPPVIEN
ncbi:uncharacterized protein YukE [Streptacidiphilus sp. MAP12-33]|uniref:WXG100 family type VII secretion target n=1 Tax=Streptacidiphilus sp. MAP12-33 TaxID=3156266 RepID=UPI00351286A1